eukprot:scaffold33021_cov20-Tisochrysis_lutea.AAC.1
MARAMTSSCHALLGQQLPLRSLCKGHPPPQHPKERCNLHNKALLNSTCRRATVCLYLMLAERFASSRGAAARSYITAARAHIHTYTQARTRAARSDTTAAYSRTLSLLNPPAACVLSPHTDPTSLMLPGGPGAAARLARSFTPQHADNLLSILANSALAPELRRTEQMLKKKGRKPKQSKSGRVNQGKHLGGVFGLDLNKHCTGMKAEQRIRSRFERAAQTHSISDIPK